MPLQTTDPKDRYSNQTAKSSEKTHLTLPAPVERNLTLPTHKEKMEVYAKKGEEVADTVDRIFNDIDSDKNGFLSNSEVSDKIKDFAQRPLRDNPAAVKERAAVIALDNGVTRNYVQTLSNDEWGMDNDGITRRDLVVLAERSQALPQYSKDHVDNALYTNKEWIARNTAEAMERAEDRIKDRLKYDK